MTRRRAGTGGIETPAPGIFLPRVKTRSGRKRLGVCSTREEAETLLDAAREVLLEKRDVEGVTLGQWGDRWLDRREADGLASVGTDRSRWRVHVARSELAALPLRAITPADVLAWLDVAKSRRAADRRGRRKLARQTLQNVLNLVRGALEDAVQRGILAENPARGVLLRMRDERLDDPWTWLELHEQEAILRCEAIPVRARLWMAFAWGTGLREGEQLNLRLADLTPLDVPHPEVIVRRGSATRGPKDTRPGARRSKVRRVPLFGVALWALQEWLRLLPSYCPSNPLGLVFPGPTGAARQTGKPLHVTKLCRDGQRRPVNPIPEYLAAAGITPERRHDGRAVRWHDLRHTCATSLLSGSWGRRWSLEEVQALLGHTSKTTTERYAHFAANALRSAAAETGGKYANGCGPRMENGDNGPVSEMHQPGRQYLNSRADQSRRLLADNRSRQAISRDQQAERSQLQEVHRDCESSNLTKPTAIPREKPGIAQEALNQGSHLRDLNPRPTVYETVVFKSDIGSLDSAEGRQWVRRALEGLARGDSADAGRVLVELVAAGRPGAARALAEAHAGRWAAGVELLAEVMGERTSREEDVARESARKAG